MLMTIKIGEKIFKFKSSKSNEWDIETRTSLRSKGMGKFDFKSWKLCPECSKDNYCDKCLILHSPQNCPNKKTSQICGCGVSKYLHPVFSATNSCKKFKPKTKKEDNK